MTQDQNGKGKKPNPTKKPEPCQGDETTYSDIKKSHDPDWSNRPHEEGYRPTDDTTNPDPPSDSGTTVKE